MITTFNQISQAITWYSATILLALARTSPAWRKRTWHQWYQFLAKTYQQAEWQFMNYGYMPLNGADTKPILIAEDEPNRYWIQLYHHLANRISLRGKTVLEISSGRGGGADYLVRYLEPAHLFGLDLAENASAFCQRHYHLANLSFMTGDSGCLPFTDNSVDVIINVEASHCYPSLKQFLYQVNRILCPGGYFLYTDFRPATYITRWQDYLKESRLNMIHQTDITPNVLAALEQTHHHKQTLINTHVHAPLQKLFETFTGQQGSWIYQAFESGELVYLSFVLQKPS